MPVTGRLNHSQTVGDDASCASVLLVAEPLYITVAPLAAARPRSVRDVAVKLIENLIDRMARNSFALKGWTVTVVGALLSLAAAYADKALAAIALYALISLAGLDTYYLALERAYRELYDQATTAADSDWGLKPRPVTATHMVAALKKARRSWCSTVSPW